MPHIKLIVIQRSEKKSLRLKLKIIELYVIKNMGSTKLTNFGIFASSCKKSTANLAFYKCFRKTFIEVSFNLFTVIHLLRKRIL